METYSVCSLVTNGHEVCLKACRTEVTMLVDGRSQWVKMNVFFL